MSIASEIARLSSAKAALKDAIAQKGVEVADDVKLDQYAAKVAAIPTGGKVLIDGWKVDANGVVVRKQSGTFKLDPVIKDIGDNVLYNIYSNLYVSSGGITAVDLSSVERVSGFAAMYGAFYGSSSVTSVDVSKIVSVTNALGMAQAFRETSITEFSMPELVSTGGNQCLNRMLMGCTKLLVARFPKLTTIRNNDTSVLGNIFDGCRALLNVYFDSLSTSTLQSLGVPFACPNTSCVFHCSDGTIQNVGGSWTIVTEG